MYQFFTLVLHKYFGVSIISMFKCGLNCFLTSGPASINGCPWRWMWFFTSSCQPQFIFVNSIVCLMHPFIELLSILFTLVIPSCSKSSSHTSVISPVSCKAPITLVAALALFIGGRRKLQASNFKPSGRPFYDCSNMSGNTVSIAGNSRNCARTARSQLIQSSTFEHANDVLAISTTQLAN